MESTSALRSSPRASNSQSQAIKGSALTENAQMKKTVKYAYWAVDQAEEYVDAVKDLLKHWRECAIEDKSMLANVLRIVGYDRGLWDALAVDIAQNIVGVETNGAFLTDEIADSDVITICTAAAKNIAHRGDVAGFQANLEGNEVTQFQYDVAARVMFAMLDEYLDGTSVYFARKLGAWRRPSDPSDGRDRERRSLTRRRQRLVKEGETSGCEYEVVPARPSCEEEQEALFIQEEEEFVESDTESVAMARAERTKARSRSARNRHIVASDDEDDVKDPEDGEQVMMEHEDKGDAAKPPKKALGGNLDELLNRIKANVAQISERPRALLISKPVSSKQYSAKVCPPRMSGPFIIDDSDEEGVKDATRSYRQGGANADQSKQFFRTMYGKKLSATTSTNGRNLKRKSSTPDLRSESVNKKPKATESEQEAARMKSGGDSSSSHGKHENSVKQTHFHAGGTDPEAAEGMKQLSREGAKQTEASTVRSQVSRAGDSSVQPLPNHIKRKPSKPDLRFDSANKKPKMVSTSADNGSSSRRQATGMQAHRNMRDPSRAAATELTQANLQVDGARAGFAVPTTSPGVDKQANVVNDSDAINSSGAISQLGTGATYPRRDGSDIKGRPQNMIATSNETQAIIQDLKKRLDDAEECMSNQAKELRETKQDGSKVNDDKPDKSKELHETKEKLRKSKDKLRDSEDKRSKAELELSETRITLWTLELLTSDGERAAADQIRELIDKNDEQSAQEVRHIQEMRDLKEESREAKEELRHTRIELETVDTFASIGERAAAKMNCELKDENARQAKELRETEEELRISGLQNKQFKEAMDGLESFIEKHAETCPCKRCRRIAKKWKVASA